MTAEWEPSGNRGALVRSDTLARIERVWPEVLRSVEAGNTPIVAAAAAGVPVRTFTRWRQQMERGDVSIAPYFEQLEIALARAEVDLVALLRDPPLDVNGKADYGRLRAAMFVLERSRRERWGPKVEIATEAAVAAIRARLDRLAVRLPADVFAQVVDVLAEDEADDALLEVEP